MHDAGLRLAHGLLYSIGDIDRNTQEDLAVSRMSGRLIRLAVGANVRGKLGQEAQTHRYKDG